jgi:HAD superfamily hydrolase (TIGR01459 family)
LGVPDTAYDSVATSGDAARHLIETWSGGRHLKLHHIGPERDLSLFAGLNVECVPLADAAYIVCTGPFDDETETPDDYNDRLLEIKKRNVPFLCANPDLVVQRGDRLIYCAGALAQRLEELGGSAIYCGKPHTPIYELAFERAAVLIGRVPTKGEVVAIGDALRTDILGAQRYGIASILIAGGIHGAEFSGTNGLDLSLVEAKCRELGARPIAVMEKLTP